jgi:hypothetical protein
MVPFCFLVGAKIGINFNPTIGRDNFFDSEGALPGNA